MAPRAILYACAVVLGVGLGHVVVRSVSVFHPIALASEAVVRALGGQ